jgi:hypothetical protein
MTISLPLSTSKFDRLDQGHWNGPEIGGLVSAIPLATAKRPPHREQPIPREGRVTVLG